MSTGINHDHVDIFAQSFATTGLQVLLLPVAALAVFCYYRFASLGKYFNVLHCFRI